MNSRNIENIGFHTLNLLNDVNKKINSCKDIHEYLNLVTSIFILKNLVIKMIESEFDAEGVADQAPYYLNMIQEEADKLTKQFVDRVSAIPGETSKTNLN